MKYIYKVVKILAEDETSAEEFLKPWGEDGWLLVSTAYGFATFVKEVGKKD